IERPVAKQARERLVLRGLPAECGFGELGRDPHACRAVFSAHLRKRRDLAVAACAALERDADKEVLRGQEGAGRDDQRIGKGVVSTTSGYTGGKQKNPTYEDVSAGVTGHAESVEVLYDPAKVGYAKLLEVFWRNIDPTTPNAQFCDHGSQYRSAIFYHDETQK